jgi:hypothetical protein
MGREKTINDLTVKIESIASYRVDSDESRKHGIVIVNVVSAFCHLFSLQKFFKILQSSQRVALCWTWA